MDSQRVPQRSGMIRGFGLELTNCGYAPLFYRWSLAGSYAKTSSSRRWTTMAAADGLRGLNALADEGDDIAANVPFVLGTKE